MKFKIKKSFICKNISGHKIEPGLAGTHIPKVGDVALFRVKEIGKHGRLQNYKGKNRLLFPGDYILCAFGHRYATNQLEGYVPASPQEEYHILGQGGVIGIVKSMYKPLEEKGPTTLEMIGYAVDENGEVMNTKASKFELARLAQKNNNRAKVILSVGSAMDSGKTTTAGYLCRGLAMAGHKVAYMKLTGTVYTKDMNFALDCGADAVTDFSAFGFPSTYLCDLPELVRLFHALMHKLEAAQPEYVVVEIADGLLQRETRKLLKSKSFMREVHDVIFSAGDSLGVVSGLDFLNGCHIKPFAVSGLFTSRPLLVQEVSEYCKADVLSLEDLEDPSVAGYLRRLPVKQQKRLANVA
ncbi:MAG TPA: hypothetical protein ENJ95_04120 [Bacteroidetes bacterium]|nr:hypothetical protein [Bacteroidota bacterium]